jgi:hypothetical protein
VHKLVQHFEYVRLILLPAMFIVLSTNHSTSSHLTLHNICCKCSVSVSPSNSHSGASTVNPLVDVFPTHRASEHHMLSVEHHQKCISLCLFEPETRLLENTLHWAHGWINSYISDCGKNLKLRKHHPLLMPHFQEI